MKKNDARSERALPVCPCCQHGAVSYDVTSGMCWTCRFPRTVA
jgi:ribosomal protein L37E